MIDADLVVPPHRTPAARAEKLMPAALAVLGAICIVGTVSLVAGLSPFAPGEVQWRVQMGAAVLSAVPQLTLLLTLISVVGVMVGQHRAVRLAAVAFFVLAAVIAALLPIFALDFLSQRQVQSLSAVTGYTRDGLRVGAAAGFLVPFMLWTGTRGWVAGRKDTEGEAGSGYGLIVGQPG